MSVRDFLGWVNWKPTLITVVALYHWQEYGMKPKGEGELKSCVHLFLFLTEYNVINRLTSCHHAFHTMIHCTWNWDIHSLFKFLCPVVVFHQWSNSLIHRHNEWVTRNGMIDSWRPWVCSMLLGRVCLHIGPCHEDTAVWERRQTNPSVFTNDAVSWQIFLAWHWS